MSNNLERSAWRAHNAIKIACNVLVLLSLSMPLTNNALFFSRFFRTCLYELVVDPVMLLATGRTSALSTISAHHALVLAWALSFLGRGQERGRTDVTAVALARVAIYAGVFNKSIYTKLVALALTTGEFACLFLSPFFSSTPSRPVDRVRDGCQVAFVLALGLFQHLGTLARLARLARSLGDVGVILAYPPSDDGTPNLYPLVVPSWGRRPQSPRLGAAPPDPLR